MSERSQRVHAFVYLSMHLVRIQLFSIQLAQQLPVESTLVLSQLHAIADELVLELVDLRSLLVGGVDFIEHLIHLPADHVVSPLRIAMLKAVDSGKAGQHGDGTNGNDSHDRYSLHFTSPWAVRPRGPSAPGNRRCQRV